ncbi:transcription initiation factor TFIID subunit 4-like [Branchiostoma floridae]|uniref:Transcription initiation factor TFIID subunit 4-like n=1 Tax=Branchiostoma floridae TaxID=7739 RepID=A0A9J7KI42_BRAFL|nr:transcription initiation factor TFIID subunit 4-like [Branchiostoma floridae]
MASNTASSPLMSSTLGTAVVQPPAQSSLTLTAEAIENVKKCKNFLTTVVKLASSSNQPPERAKNVKELVQNLLDAKIEPEEFTLKLQTEFKSSPQPYLVPLLKKTLPYVRQGLAKRGAIGGMQIPPQTPSFAQAPVAMTTSLVASTSISRQSVVVTTQSQHPPNVRQQAAINTAQMTVNPNLDLGTTSVTSGGLPPTTAQIPTAPSLGTSLPPQVARTVSQASTGVGGSYGLQNMTASTPTQLNTRNLERMPLPAPPIRHVHPGMVIPFVRPNRTTASPTLPTALPPSSVTRGTTTLTTGELPYTTPQIPTARRSGTVPVPRQAAPTDRQEPNNEQFPYSPLVFSVPYHR